MIRKIIPFSIFVTLAGCGDNRDVQYFIDHKAEREETFEKCRIEEGPMAKTQLCQNVYLAAKEVRMNEMIYAIDRKK